MVRVELALDIESSDTTNPEEVKSLFWSWIQGQGEFEQEVFNPEDDNQIIGHITIVNGEMK